MISILTILLQILEVTNAFSRSGFIRTTPTLQQQIIASSQPSAWRRAGRRGGLSLSNDGIVVESTLRNDTLDGIVIESTLRNDTLDIELPLSVDSETIAIAQEKEMFFATIVVPTPEEIISFDEDVSAILEASQDAIAAAEASMLEELIQKLELGGGNKTVATIAVEPELPEIVPAAAVVGEPIVSRKISAPPVSKILKFAIPAIGVWLCGPLLSLIDTSAVGILSGTTQQAALNPAVAVTDYAALLIVSTLFGDIHGRCVVLQGTSDELFLLRLFEKYYCRPSCTREPQTWWQRHKNLIVQSRANLEQPRI
jgi:hypothetical protein